MGYISMDKRCSNFTVEAVAILKAMRLMENVRNEKNIIIYTDALIVIQAIINIIKLALIQIDILEIRKKYFKLSTEIYRKNKKMVIFWFPAHIGETGNEITDRLAKEATEEESTRKIEVSIGDLSVIYKDEMKRNTTKECNIQGRHKGKEYYNTRSNYILNEQLDKIGASKPYCVCRMELDKKRRAEDTENNT